jgi:hypothetical protein
MDQSFENDTLPLFHALPLTLFSSLPHCSSCSSPTPAFMCSHCRSALYCTRACQRSHLAAHQTFCAQLSALCAPVFAFFCDPLPTAPLCAQRRLAQQFLASCRGKVDTLISSYTLGTMLEQSRTPVHATLQLKAALATARELGGCDFLPALLCSTTLARCMLLSGHHGPGLALILDTHTRLARTMGALSLTTLVALNCLLNAQPFSQRMLSEAALRARAALQGLGIPIPASASTLGMIELAVGAIDKFICLAVRGAR